MRRFLLKALALIVVLLSITTAAAYMLLRQSLPIVGGVVTVTGVSAPIDIVRDADAVTHVFAATKLDALYGLGYAHAQDRLWQMEFQRRIGHGRLSEVFGRISVPTDRFLRTVGFGRAARSAWSALPHGAREQIDAYVAGINEFISTHHGARLPPEFTLLRFEPEPWTGPDVMVWVKMMAWDLSKNYTFELLRHDLLATVGPRMMAELLPPYAEEGLSILSAADMPWLKRGTRSITSDAEASPAAAVAASSWSDAFAAALDVGLPATRDFLRRGRSSALGSNNWVVDGTMTASGKPLLANDPHLGAQVPSLWYLAHLSAGDLDVIGATLPGAPGVAIGRNRRIAWGETNVAADVEDLYRERLDPTGKLVEFRGAQEPIELVPETILVKDAAPVRIEVRITRHGPLVSDAINANNAESKRDVKPQPLEPLAFRWTALDRDDSTVVSFFKLNDARNWDDFTAALRDFVVPSQNFVYADVDGHIGYYAPGRIPIRERGDGGAPVDGAAGDHEWTGWIPFEELPHTFDPPEHFVVTANNRPVPPAYPAFLSLEWTEPYRAQRIADLLRAKPKLTPDDFARIQADTRSLHAQALLPVLLGRVHPVDRADQQAVDIVRTWDDDARGDSAAAAIVEAWLLELTPRLVSQRLGPRLTVDYTGLDRSSYVARFLASTLASDASPWCDDAGTPQRETCGDAVTSALHGAVRRLTAAMGGDMSRWRWDAVHRATFPHQGLDAVALLRPLLSRSAPHGGDWSTVNVGPVFADRPFEQHSIPSYRQIVDLSPANDNRFIDAVGESGHPLSPHYDDFLVDWQAVRYRPMRMNRADAEKGAIGTLRLVPRQR